MWGAKKFESAGQPAQVPPAREEAARRMLEVVPNKSLVTSLEGKTMNSDAMRPSVGQPAGSSARLGASLRVKGEISGNEDLHVDGTVEGLIHLDDRKLTVGI